MDDDFLESGSSEEAHPTKYEEESTEQLPTSDYSDQTPISAPFLTKYERTRLIGVRAQQLAMGAESTLSPQDLQKSNDPVRIAEQELNKGHLPLKVRRFFPDGSWSDY